MSKGIEYVLKYSNITYANRSVYVSVPKSDVEIHNDIVCIYACICDLCMYKIPLPNKG